MVLARRLCIQPSDFADVYVLSFGSLHEEESIHWEVYQRVKEIAENHLISIIRTMLWECKRWASKNEQEDNVVLAALEKMIELGVTQIHPSEILASASIDDVLAIIGRIFDKHHPNWLLIVKTAKKLLGYYQESMRTGEFNNLLIWLTLLHQRLHAAGGAVLELMLYPGKKHLAYKLLLMQRSRDLELNKKLILENGTPRAIKLLQKYRRRQPPFYLLALESTGFEQEQVMMAKCLLEDEALTGRIDIVTINLAKVYPLFRIVSRIFNYSARPDLHLQKLAEVYLLAAVEQDTTEPCRIIKHLLKQEEEQMIEILLLTQLYPQLRDRLEGETSLVSCLISAFASGEFSAVRNALIFLETYNFMTIITNQEKKDELEAQLRKITTSYERDTYESKTAKSLLG